MQVVCAIYESARTGQAVRISNSGSQDAQAESSTVQSSTVPSSTVQPVTVVDAMRARFEHFDTNGDGVLDLDEVRTMMISLGFEHPDQMYLQRLAVSDGSCFMIRANLVHRFEIPTGLIATFCYRLSSARQMRITPAEST
eukprot:SAG31_NODE_4420_length_3250_cov_1.490003_3_plen_140_part_00